MIHIELIIFAVGFGAILGHIYPLWHDFCGGKGGATAAGVICVVAPEVAFLVIPIWFVVVLVTRYVGLATMSVVVGASVYIGATQLPQQIELFVFSIMVAVLILYTHRENIKRMRQGTESRTEIIRLGR